MRGESYRGGAKTIAVSVLSDDLLFYNASAV